MNLLEQLTVDSRRAHQAYRHALATQAPGREIDRLSKFSILTSRALVEELRRVQP